MISSGRPKPCLPLNMPQNPIYSSGAGLLHSEAADVFPSLNGELERAYLKVGYAHESRATDGDLGRSHRLRNEKGRGQHPSRVPSMLGPST